MRINIKRLLTNTDSLSIIDSLAGNEEFAILNHQGKLVYGSDNHKTIAVHEVEVRVNDVYIALVKSSNSRKAGVIAK